VSIRFGPNLVGQYDAAGKPLKDEVKPKRRGKGADDGFCPRRDKSQNQKEGGLTAASLCMTNQTDHVPIKPDNLKS